MKDEYDFSGAERGIFHHVGACLIPLVHVEPPAEVAQDGCEPLTPTDADP